LEGAIISPRIAELHAGGAVRGFGAAGMRLARLHDVAEASGKAQVVLLAAVIVLHIVSLPRQATASTEEGGPRRR